MKYAVVIEFSGKNYSAYVPDLPGCVATARTLATVQRRIAEAIDLHIAGLNEDGLPIPEATTLTQYVRSSKPKRARNSRAA